MTPSKRDRKAYALAKEYLLALDVEGITPQLIEKYLRFSQTQARPGSLAGIYRRILQSAQEANMRTGVIGKGVGGVDNFAVVLCDFQPLAVIARYATWESLLDEIQRRLKPKGKIRRTPRSVWPQYCRTILSAARFVAQFSTADDFYEWVDLFDGDDRVRPALAMLLAAEIDGVGFALGCNFLIDLGYSNFTKPDVHLRDIFTSLGLCATKASDYQVFKAVVRVARNANVTPYDADKLFWLIGSGHFFDDDQIGDKGRIGSHKTDFIAYAKSRLSV